LLGSKALSVGSALDLHTMLVGARAQDRIVSFEELPSLHDIGEDHGVKVADMRRCGMDPRQSRGYRWMEGPYKH
jgi:hypothetical protein